MVPGVISYVAHKKKQTPFYLATFLLHLGFYITLKNRDTDCWISSFFLGKKNDGFFKTKKQKFNDKSIYFTPTMQHRSAACAFARAYSFYMIRPHICRTHRPGLFLKHKQAHTYTHVLTHIVLFFFKATKRFQKMVCSLFFL